VDALMHTRITYIVFRNALIASNALIPVKNAAKKKGAAGNNNGVSFLVKK